MDTFDINHFVKDAHSLIDKDPQAVVQRCEAALSIAEKKDHHRIYGVRASAIWCLGEYDSALIDIENARRLDPEWAAHPYHATHWLIDLQRFPEAVSTADILLKLEAERESIAFVGEARFLKAYALIRLGDNGAACDVLSQVKDEKPIWIDGRLISKSDLEKSAGCRPQK
jgi:tetratricopeptide (TPR) repeat protein